ncbi:beta-galactosidase-1-like protein isoform X1 [Psammomys obesus]|uniref:beta-galactosidase-1-like protein isoform X1 n=1 Tax=Psammomys obesus TaxID=48139 RepID=UPI0024529B3B|nr:beta-galactosidase-1-like protein isoform X1 [Psammomys obesus]XP_055473120.1 beta-galactosidase-1-like protein isoform X1 [Psammomys obesus]XP_055473121.1 beta-galactosidase-1-like protein isoform X1 [Psammomys obesus]XP_055473122.1 beta-galactosidase-1-like protein isoform X1 [Psammomys obesus]XP_055473123.1 beta-galactosidase-1-like protein isoform X1 [Psammomys obesus]
MPPNPPSLLLRLVLLVLLSQAEGRFTRSFVVDRQHDRFLLNGVPFRYISGSLHYFRVPPVLWADRLLKMKLSGLNAVQFYVPWNYHEAEPGVYNFNGSRDLIAFLNEAAKVNLLVILRPGPYICAEWEMGGLPSWLLRKPNIRLRTSDPAFLAAVDSWFEVLLPKIYPFLYHNGGNIISIQVENEYGSYKACDFKYMKHLAGLFRALLGDKILLFTTDGPHGLKCGSLQGLYTTVDFGPADNVTKIFSILRNYEPHGPLVNSEYYTGWLDYWGQNHSTRSSPTIAHALEKMLKMGASVNMYMFHGGTNFGYWNGADEKGRFLPITTSYDYDAPISEAGDPTPKLFAIRSVISKFQEIPLGPLPPPSPKMKLGPLTMNLDGNLLAFLDFLCPHGPIHSVLPLTFEAVKQDHGFMLYRTYMTYSVFKPTPFWVPNNGVHDRAYVMVDGVFKGVLERNLKHQLYLTVKAGAKLDILLENMGRLSFGSNHSDFKGLLEPPLLGQTILTEWMIFPLKVDKLVRWWFPLQLLKRAQPEASSVPAFYSTTFSIVGLLGDTFLYLPGWTKGQVWINGFNLGRYWTNRGPQQTLYVPRLLLFSRSINKITLLELENVPHDPKIQFLDTPILNSTLHWGYTYVLSEQQKSYEPMELSGH